MTKLFRFIACSSFSFLCIFPLNAKSNEIQDLKFETVLFPQDIISPKGNDVSSVLIALKITNMTKVSIAINKYQTPIPVVESSNGKVLKTIVQSDLLIAAEKGDYFMLKAGHATYILVDASIKNQDGKLIIYGISKDGSEWSVNIMDHETYKISLKYKPDNLSVPNSPLTPWTGDVVSPSTTLLLID